MMTKKAVFAASVLLSIAAAGLGSPAGAQTYKMTTPIAPGVATPDALETSIGALSLKDGVPTPETSQKIWDNLDRSRALQAYLLAIPIVNQAGMRIRLLKFGPVNRTNVIWENLVDPRTVELTANDNTIYSFIWIDTKGGPVVVEIPPRVLGTINDFWYKWVIDVGLTGPDKGRGREIPDPAARIHRRGAGRLHRGSPDDLWHVDRVPLVPCRRKDRAGRRGGEKQPQDLSARPEGQSDSRPIW